MKSQTPTLAATQHKLHQLQALRDSGSLSEDAYNEARMPLERQLVDLVMAGQTADKTASQADAVRRPSGRLKLGVAAGVVALAAAGYAYTGSPTLAGLGAPPVPAQADGGGPTDAQVAEMVTRLAQHLKEQPDDAKGWGVLARAYAAMGRHAEAIPAFQKVMALSGESADVLVDYADTLAAQTGGKLGPEGVKMVERALVLEPGNLKGQAMLGSAAYDKADYATAVRLWERVAAALPPDNGFLPQLQASIAQARQLGGMPAAAPAVPTASVVAPPGATPAAMAATAVSGTVSLAPALAARASPDDTVFIVARAANGPRMPLAVMRKQVKDLPISFTLDDSMAMAPTAKISDNPQVIVIARVSKSGQALPQPGDLGGQSAPVAPGAQGVAVQITEVVPAK